MHFLIRQSQTGNLRDIRGQKYPLMTPSLKFVFLRGAIFFALCSFAFSTVAAQSQAAPDSTEIPAPAAGPDEDGVHGTIRGVVKTSDDQPAAGVSIIIKGSPRGATTDELGAFEFRKVKAGDYTLQVSLTGYEAIEQNVTVAAGTSSAVSVKLDISSKALQEVVVTAAKNPLSSRMPSSSLRLNEPLIEAPQNIQVVSSKALADQQIVSMSDGVIRNVSGAVRYAHWGDLYTNIQMRGSQLTAMRNGMPVATSYWSPLTEDMAVVDHIEFVKGPAGFLMSVGDPAGVYNVVTKRPTGETKGELSVSAGSWDFYRATADFQGKLDKDGKLLYRLNVAGKQANSFRRFEYNDRYTIAPVLSYKPDDNTTLTVEYLLNHVKSSDVGSYYVFTTKGYGVLPRSFTPLDPGMDPTYITDQSLTLNLTHQFDEHWKFTAQAAYLDYKQKGTSLWATSVSADSMIRSVGLWDAASTAKFFQAYLNGHFSTGAVQHRTMIGFDANVKEYLADFYQARDLDLPDAQFVFSNPDYGAPSNGYPVWDRSKSLAQRAGPYGTQSQTYTGIYLQDELGFFDNKLRLTLAGRYSYVKTNDYGSAADAKQFTPRAGLSYSVDKETSVYALFDQAFTPQSGVRRDSGTIKPLTGSNIELGVKREFAGGKWTATADVYRIIRNNGNTTDPSDPQGRYVIQLGQTRSEGIEFDLRGEVARGLTVTANYAYTNAYITKTDSSLVQKATIGQKVPGYATHTANGWITYQFQTGLLKGLGLSGGITCMAGRQNWEYSAASAKKMLSDYTRIDAGISYETGHYQFNLNMFNVADAYLYSGSGYSNYYYYQAEAPRNLRFSIAYRF